jgi:hypothetical protein
MAPRTRYAMMRLAVVLVAWFVVQPEARYGDACSGCGFCEDPYTIAWAEQQCMMQNSTLVDMCWRPDDPPHCCYACGFYWVCENDPEHYHCSEQDCYDCGIGL